MARVPNRLREGFVAGGIAGIVSGMPSTAHAVVSGRSPLDAIRAAGTLLLSDDAPAASLAVAGTVVHAGLSLAWGAVLAIALPRRHTVAWGGVAGLAIAALDLGVLGRRWPRVRGLPLLPQIADHVAFGAVAGMVVSVERCR